jgi:hypothetical protein
MQTKRHNKRQNHDPYARNHPTEIIVYVPRNNQNNMPLRNPHGDSNMNPRIVTGIASTIGAVGGGYVARSQQSKLPLKINRDMPRITLGAGLTFTGSSLIVTAINPTSTIMPVIIAGGITYLMFSRDSQDTDSTTHNSTIHTTNTARRTESVNTEQNSLNTASIHQPATDNANSDNPLHKHAQNIRNTVKNLWKSLFVNNQTKQKPVKEEFEFFTEEELQKAREAIMGADEEQKQQAEARASRRAYMQTDEYKEKQRQEAEEKKRAKERDEQEWRENSARFTQKASEYLRAKNAERREAQPQNPQLNTRPSYKMSEILKKIEPTRRAEVDKALSILKPYLKDKALTIEGIIEKVLPHNSVQSENQFNKTQNKNVRKLQNLYHPNKIHNLSPPPEKQDDVSKQLSIISGFITNLKNITYHFKFRDQTE